MISSLLTLRTPNKPELAEFAGEMDAAIRSLAQAQDFVMPIGPPEEQQLLGLLDLLLQPHRTAREEAITLRGDNTKIGARSATPLALIVHELATNAVKYGALSVSDGRVAIETQQVESAMVIRWQESDGPQVQEPQATGFGTRLLKTTIENQLGGTINRSWQSEGFACTITIPLAHLAE